MKQSKIQSETIKNPVSYRRYLQHNVVVTICVHVGNWRININRRLEQNISHRFCHSFGPYPCGQMS